MLQWLRRLFIGPSNEAIQSLYDELIENRKGYQRMRARIYRAKNYIFEELGTVEEFKKNPNAFKHELKILDILDGKRK